MNTKEKKPRGRPKKVKESVKEEEPLIVDVANPEPQMSATEILNKIYTQSYENITVYIYYASKGASAKSYDLDTYTYIKKVQQILDHFKIGSQVVIYAPERFESVGINNCYHVLSEPKQWTDICLAKNDCVQVLIKERPKLSEVDFVRFLKTTTKYEDDYVCIQEFIY